MVANIHTVADPGFPPLRAPTLIIWPIFPKKTAWKILDRRDGVPGSDLGWDGDQVSYPEIYAKNVDASVRT